MKLPWMIFVMALLTTNSYAMDFDASCVESILKSSGKKIRQNNEYLEKHRALVSYTYYDGDQTQEVYTETGRTFVDEVQNTFLCTPTSRNPKRSLAKKMNEIFEKVFKAKKGKKSRDKFLADVFTYCSRSNLTELKKAISKKRAASIRGESIQSDAVGE